MFTRALLHKKMFTIAFLLKECSELKRNFRSLSSKNINIEKGCEMFPLKLLQRGVLTIMCQKNFNKKMLSDKRLGYG